MSKRAPNMNSDQKTLLIEFVRKNPQLQEGKFAKDFTYKDGQRLWQHIAEELNSISHGGSKNWRQWRKVWQDFKTKNKSKRTFLIKQKLQSSGTTPTPQPARLLLPSTENVSNLTLRKIQIKEDYYKRKLELYEKHIHLIEKDVEIKKGIADSLKQLTNVLIQKDIKEEGSV